MTMWLMAVRLALLSLSRNKLRATLTVLGILIGIAAVVTMTALGDGAKASIQGQMSALGVNLLWVQPGSNTSGGVRGAAGSRATLTEDDGDAIAREIASVQSVAPVLTVSAQLVVGASNVATRVTGSTPDYFRVRDWGVSAGRLFDDADVRSASKVCVIGETVRGYLFGTADPVGRVVRIGRLPCTVIGLLTAKGQGSFGQDYDDTVVMPVTSVRGRLKGSGGREVDQLMVSVRDQALMHTAEDQLSELLRQRHRIAGDQEDDFYVRNLQDLMNTLEQTRSTLSTLLLSIAAIALLVGGIGVMNIMLVSVTERTREIGIRLAVGATAGDILAQFLVEAVTLSLIGGAAGLLMGYGAGVALGRAMQWSVAFSPSAAVVAFATSAGIGVVFGFFPARRAARMDPIAALRHE